MRLCGIVALFSVLFTTSVASAQTVLLRGTVLDPSGAVIPGADLKVTQGDRVIGERKSDATGNFAFDLTAGDYKIEASAPEFKSHVQNVRVIPNIRPIAISLAVATLSAAVDVAANDDTVSLEEDANLTTTSISDDTIKALPEDEDALMAQLQALAAGTGAAGASASFVVDGFSNGRIPPRDQIQQIIIDTNVFSAESAGGGPRIQIITKPGTGPWSGNLNANFNDQYLNARNPLDINRPKKQQTMYTTSYGGPVIPGKLTLRVTARNLRIDQEGTSIVAVTPGGPINQGVFSPYRNENLNSNGQIFISQSNSLSYGVNYNSNWSLNQGIGGTTLPERALNFKGHNWNFQLSDRATINPRLTSEIRYFMFHNQNSLLPVTEAVQINVLDAFGSGGAQNRTRRRNTYYNFGNTIRWTARPTLNLQIGTDFTESKQYSNSETNYLGVFTFSSLGDYLAGHPITFRKTTGDPIVNIDQLEFAGFIQADWRATSKLNLGAGLRYQVQQNLNGHGHLGPTAQIAYQPRNGTVVRAGARISYQVYDIGNTETVLRSGPSHQLETVILNPSYPDPFANLDPGAVSTNNASIRTQAANLVAPYTINSALTWEQNLRKGWRFSTSFDTTRGVHLIRTRNVNAPYPGTPLPPDLFAQLNSFDPVVQSAARDQVDRMRPLYPTIGNIYQFESSADSFSKNLGLRLYTPNNFRFHRIGIDGFVQYVLGWAYDNGSAQNQYNWRSEWSLSSFDSRSRLTSNLNIKLPKDISMSFLITARSGRPYSLTTGQDNNGDQTTNDRPSGVPRNSLTGPGFYNVNANFTKTIPLRRAESSKAAAANAGVPQVVGGPGGPTVIPQSSGNPATGPRLQFNVSANNLLNNTQLRGYSGVLTSPLFGKPTGAAAGRSVTAGLGILF
jgi:hypothetical protein